MITNHYPLSTLPHSHFSGTVCINILVTRLTGVTGILIFELEREVAVVTKIVDTATDLYHQVFVVFVDCFIIAWPDTPGPGTGGRGPDRSFHSPVRLSCPPGTLEPNIPLINIKQMECLQNTKYLTTGWLHKLSKVTRCYRLLQTQTQVYAYRC